MRSKPVKNGECNQRYTHENGCAERYLERFSEEDVQWWPEKHPKLQKNWITKQALSIIQSMHWTSYSLSLSDSCFPLPTFAHLYTRLLQLFKLFVLFTRPLGDRTFKWDNCQIVVYNFQLTDNRAIKIREQVQSNFSM